MRLQIVDLVPVEREGHEFVGLGVLIAPVPDVLDLPDPDGLLIDPSHEIAGGTWKIGSGLPPHFLVLGGSLGLTAAAGLLSALRCQIIDLRRVHVEDDTAAAGIRIVDDHLGGVSLVDLLTRQV